MRRPLLFILSLLALVSVEARAAEWIPIGPFGGTAKSLVVAPSDPRVLYAGTRGAGVFRTTNGGATWAPSRRGFSASWVASLALGPASSGETSVIYVGNPGHRGEPAVPLGGQGGELPGGRPVRDRAEPAGDRGGFRPGARGGLRGGHGEPPGGHADPRKPRLRSHRTALEAEGLGNSRVQILQVDEAGTLYAGTNWGGVYRLDRD